MESLLPANMLGLKTMDGATLSFSPNCSSFSRHSKLSTIPCRASTTLDMGRKSKTNFYKVLSLESQAVGFEEIKKAYRRLALQYHPDVSPPSRKEESTRMFVELHRAYETLSNPVSRREHDLELSMDESDSLSMCLEFSRQTWEVQLRNLVRRSELREREKAGSRRR